ncbi:MAG: M20/M25/M40 family metallo-hydrolase [Candidatus Dormibacteria bacterium]
MAANPIPARLLSWLERELPAWRQVLDQLVACESPSGDGEGLRECSAICAAHFAQRAGLDRPEVVGSDRAPVLRLRRRRAGRGAPVLLLGHLDTVWERGGYRAGNEPRGERVLGPGVFDMKGGVVVALAALAALDEAELATGPITVLLTGDEEVGSPTSRALIEEEARQHAAALVLEPPQGPAVKVARKGVSQYRVVVQGRAAHAGLDPASGINAVVALAELVPRIAALSRSQLGTTVSPTVIKGGGRSNVIPAQAELVVDVRFSRAAEAERVDRGLQALAVSGGAEVEVRGGVNRPPLERPASDGLFRLAASVWAELGRGELDGVAVGGGSDGSFTAALGVPTLDGLGIVGGHAHADGEWADPGSIPERAALLAGLLQRVGAGALR